MAFYRATLGGGGGNAPELLWVNPNISNLAGVSFAAQTINENSSGWVSGKQLSDYDGFIFGTLFNSSDYNTRGANLGYVTRDVSSLATPFPNNYVPCIVARNVPNGTANHVRNITISSSGLDISTSTGGDTTCVPMYIWGVKGDLTN